MYFKMFKKYGKNVVAEYKPGSNVIHVDGFCSWNGLVMTDKTCPFCNELPHNSDFDTYHGMRWCCTKGCPLYLKVISVEQWNTRGCIKQLEDEEMSMPKRIEELEAEVERLNKDNAELKTKLMQGSAESLEEIAKGALLFASDIGLVKTSPLTAAAHIKGLARLLLKGDK